MFSSTLQRKEREERAKFFWKKKVKKKYPRFVWIFSTRNNTKFVKEESYLSLKVKRWCSNPAKNHTRREMRWLTRIRRPKERKKKNGGWFSEIRRSFVHRSRINPLPFPRRSWKISAVYQSHFQPLLKSQHPWSSKLRIASEQFMNRFEIGYSCIYIYKLLLCSSGRFVLLPMMRLLNIQETVFSEDESLY